MASQRLRGRKIRVWKVVEGLQTFRISFGLRSLFIGEGALRSIFEVELFLRLIKLL